MLWILPCFASAWLLLSSSAPCKLKARGWAEPQPERFLSPSTVSRLRLSAIYNKIKVRSSPQNTIFQPLLRAQTWSSSPRMLMTNTSPHHFLHGLSLPRAALQNSHAGGQGHSCALVAPSSLTWGPHPHSPVPSFKPSPGLSPAPACTLLLSPVSCTPGMPKYQGSAGSRRTLFQGVTGGHAAANSPWSWVCAALPCCCSPFWDLFTSHRVPQGQLGSVVAVGAHTPKPQPRVVTAPLCLHFLQNQLH